MGEVETPLRNLPPPARGRVGVAVVLYCELEIDPHPATGEDAGSPPSPFLGEGFFAP
jgi:hypothetical protein